MAPGVVDEKQRRRMRIAVAVFFFISGFGFSTWASRIPDIQQQLNLNEAELGGVLFVLPVGLMLTLPVTGTLLARYNSRVILMMGTVLFNLMMSMLGFVTEVWQLSILLFCFGSSRNLMNISVNAQSVGVQAHYEKSIIASFHGIWSLAGFAGAAIGSMVVSTGIKPAYHFLFVGIILSIISILFFPATLHQLPHNERRKASFQLPNKAMFKLGIITFACMACEGTMYDWSGVYFRKAVHVPDKFVTVGYVVYMISMTLGRLTGDKLINKFGIKNMLVSSGILVTVGFTIASVFPHAISAAAGFMLVGFGVSCVVPLIFSIAGKSKEMSSGSSIAAVSTVGYFGFLMVPPLIGFVAHEASLRWSFGIMGLLGILITLMVRTLKVEQR
jgi:MFS family permease